MASLQSFALRARLALHSKQLQAALPRPLSLNRYASTASPPKPRVLEKPERFNPPSHPSRLRSKPRQYPGPPLSEHERAAQRKRRYPHMMPPEGTFMYWFLTSQLLHLWITLSILVSLVIATWYLDFINNTPYLDLLPPSSMFLSHPFSFIGRYFDVYRMHVDYVSLKTAERRKRNVDDAQKRSEYRKAHGLDQNGGLVAWLAKTDAELLDASSKESGRVQVVSAPTSDVQDESLNTIEASVEGQENVAIQIENPEPARKRWFGIW